MYIVVDSFLQSTSLYPFHFRSCWKVTPRNIIIFFLLSYLLNRWAFGFCPDSSTVYLHWTTILFAACALNQFLYLWWLFLQQTYKHLYMVSILVARSLMFIKNNIEEYCDRWYQIKSQDILIQSLSSKPLTIYGHHTLNIFEVASYFHFIETDVNIWHQHQKY